MSSPLKQKTIKGVGWSFADNIASQGITFLVGLILARLLSPDEFGLIGMITIFIAISTSFVDSGFSSALIRKINVRDIDYNTVFYFNLGVGTLFYFLLFAASPLIGQFFDEYQLVSITRLMGVILIINSIAIIQRTILVRKVDFKTQTKVSVISSIISGLIGIGLALLGYGVWSLVWQQISRQFINSLFLWLLNDWRPSLEFSIKSFKEMFGFGSKLLLSGLIDTVYKNIYYIVIGKFYSAAQLGQYTRAEQFNSIFSSNLTTVVQRVSFPVLSSIQDEEEKLRIAYRKVIKTTMLVTFSCMLGLAAIAKPLILFLIGAQWLEAVILLQIICFAGMLYPLHAINLNILQVKGRSDIFLKLEVIKKIIGVLPIVVGIFGGIKSMLVCSVITSFIAYLLNSYYSAELIGYSTKKQLFDILPTFLIAIAIAAIMWLFSFLSLPYIIVLILQCTIGLGLAFIVYEKTKLEEYQEIKYILLSIIKRKRDGQ